MNLKASAMMKSKFLLLVVLVGGVATVMGMHALSLGGNDDFSRIKSDERIVFFDTAAHLDERSEQWILPVHGWIHELEHRRVRKAAIAKTLSAKYGLEATAATRKNFERRVDLFCVDNERGKTIGVRVAGRLFAMPESGPNGHIRKALRIQSSSVTQSILNGVLSYRAEAKGLDNRPFVGRVHLIPPEGLSVISDIDDTVKVSHVRDRTRLLDNTFFQDFKAVPGMADRYREWAKKGVRFHFVSSSPWHLYEPLKEFAEKSGFPPATFSLKLVRLKDKTLFNLMKKGTETKPLQIEPLLKKYPRRRFLLIGDSGEQDPEVYAALIRKYPKQIARVYIRNVTRSSPDDDRFREIFSGIDRKRWALFTDPATLELPN